MDDHADKLTPLDYTAHDTLAVQAEARGSHTWRWLCLSDEARQEARATVFASLAEHGLNELGATKLIREQFGSTAGFQAWRERELAAARERASV